MTGVSEGKPPTRRERSAVAYFEKQRDLCDRFGAPLAMLMTRIGRDEEMDLVKLYAEYRSATDHPLLASCSRFEIRRHSDRGHELHWRFSIGRAPHAIDYAGAAVVDRREEITRMGALNDGVRYMVDVFLRNAESGIADAIDKERNARA